MTTKRTTMSRAKLYALIPLFVLLSTAPMNGQSSAGLYQEAERAYNMGRFELVDSLLSGQAALMKGDDGVKAYRLLALSRIYLDDIPGAENYIRSLLTANPYYTPYGDTPRFTELVNVIKRGSSTTITTASQQAETIEEAPVPVTIITEEMLRSIGARNLKEALMAFVPGMTDVANNEEMNVAMRGIYSSGQEKILILLNGHRMNSYSTNVAAPDFSLSLEKVKQIEVLRGPASSIYGGVALTGVVNLITKDGGDIDGMSARASVGNYGQVKGDILFGKTYMDINVMAWASVYSSAGEKIHLKESEQPYATQPVEGDIIIGGYNHQPSYDGGISLKSGKVSAFFNRRFSKAVAPYSLSFFFAPYSYDRYRKWNSNTPGYAVTSDNAEVSYASKAGRLSWQAKLFYDHQVQQRYQVSGDVVPEVGFNDIIPNGVEDVVVKMYNGGFQSVNWSENMVGAKFQGGLDYKLGENHSGNITFGADAGFFSLLDATYMEGIDYDLLIKTYNDEKVLNTGKEKSADAYVQVKHKAGSHFILNAGLRYDFKPRKNGMTINDFSPRLALIYINPRFDLKVSYAKSFVDAPYFYRNNTLDINFGDESMRPEYMN
ncbi:MAG: TonB-dependent receptor, partial [Bacteroidales bacterium]|nr:TonB-dependent receptor [Candidatus Cacconaster merdequi]